MTPTKEQIKIMRFILRAESYSADEVDEIMEDISSWYEIWLEFRAIALAQMRAGINCGTYGYLGQMQILGEIRKKCPARGNKPYEVDNNYAPIFARFYNAIVKKPYFELRNKKQKEAA
jgi:hypothetical protein